MSERRDEMQRPKWRDMTADEVALCEILFFDALKKRYGPLPEEPKAWREMFYLAMQIYERRVLIDMDFPAGVKIKPLSLNANYDPVVRPQISSLVMGLLRAYDERLKEFIESRAPVLQMIGSDIGMNSNRPLL